MSTTFTYGLILAITNIALSLIGFFLGYQTDKMAQGQWFQWLVYLAIFGVIWFGIRAVREESKDKSLSYGRGVGTGVMIALYAGLIGGVYGYIHFAFINPDFTEYLVQFVRAQNAAKGVPDAQLDAIDQGIRFMYRPLFLAIISPIFYVCIGLVGSLIMSIFLKRAPAEPPAAAA